MLDSLGESSQDWAWAVSVAGHVLADTELIGAAVAELARHALKGNAALPLLSAALSFLASHPQQQLEQLKKGIRQAVGGCEPSELLLVVLLLRLDQLAPVRDCAATSKSKGKSKKDHSAAAGGAAQARLEEQQLADLLQQVDWGSLKPAELTVLGSLLLSCKDDTAALQLVKVSLLEQSAAALVPAASSDEEEEEQEEGKEGKAGTSYLATWYPSSVHRPPGSVDGAVMGRIKSFAIDVRVELGMREGGEYIHSPGSFAECI